MIKSMKFKHIKMTKYLITISILAQSLIAPFVASAREVEYKGNEIEILVVPGEPTQLQFPDEIQGGFKKNLSSLHIDRKNKDLIVFASEGLPDKGEAVIVRLKNGKSYSIRIIKTTEISERDDVVEILDDRRDYAKATGNTKEFEKGVDGFAPPSAVSGLMRELVLSTEFGKTVIPGYRPSERYTGETVLNDGAVKATIKEIYLGPELWGYVLEAENMLDQTIQLNPATFRLDGTRAISATRWELKPRPMNIEQQIAKAEKAYVYIVTKARRLQ
jgi:hypothetical protein